MHCMSLERMVNCKSLVGTIITPEESIDFCGKDTLPEDEIIEFYFDSKKHMFKPIKIRHDKNTPNFIDVANDIWMHISVPIKKEQLKKWFNSVLFETDSEAVKVHKMCSVYKDTYHVGLFDDLSQEAADIFVKELKLIKNRSDLQQKLFHYMKS